VRVQKIVERLERREPGKTEQRPANKQNEELRDLRPGWEPVARGLSFVKSPWIVSNAFGDFHSRPISVEQGRSITNIKPDARVLPALVKFSPMP